jgi:hypothetical protein
VYRGPIRLFKYVGLLGCGLSAAGLLLAVGLRIDAVFRRPVGGPNSPDGALLILDAFKEPGATFLLAAILYVVCEIALQLPRRPPDPAAPDHHD